MKNIIQKYKKNVQTIIRRMTGTCNEDIEQEIYIKTWRNLDKYKEQNKFTAWLNTICYNCCRDFLRVSKNQNKNIVTDEEVINDIKDPNEKNSDVILDSLQRQKIILREINRLPVKLKKVIIYYELEDRSYEDISLILNIPIGTVKSRLYKAREILKETLKDLL